MKPFSEKINRTKFVERKISYNLPFLIKIDSDQLFSGRFHLPPAPPKFPVFVVRNASAARSEGANVWKNKKCRPSNRYVVVIRGR